METRIQNWIRDGKFSESFLWGGDTFFFLVHNKETRIQNWIPDGKFSESFLWGGDTFFFLVHNHDNYAFFLQYIFILNSPSYCYAYGC